MGAHRLEATVEGQGCHVTQSVGTPAGTRSSLWGRRLAARLVDTLLAVALSALVVWPGAWSAAGDALAAAGFSSVADFLGDWDAGSAAGTAAAQAADALQPVVLGAVLLQTLVIWLYETLATTIASTTPGKALQRLRIHVHHGDSTVPAPGQPPHRSWPLRLLRMGLRAALVMVPPALAVGMSLAGALGAAEAASVAEVAIALTAVLGLFALIGDAGVHGLLTGTRVASFRWEDLRAEAQRLTSDEAHLQQLRAAADQSPAGRRARERLQRAARSDVARQGRAQVERAGREDPQQLVQRGRQALEQHGIRVGDERVQQFSKAVDTFLSRARQQRRP